MDKALSSVIQLMLLLTRNWTSRDPLQPKLFHDSEAEKVGQF